jgi:hypothetical protein
MKVTIAGEQRDVVVDAGLRDQRVGELGPIVAADQVRAELAGATPEAGLDLKHWQHEQIALVLGGEQGVAQQLGKDDRSHNDGAESQRLIEQIGVTAAETGEIGDPAIGVSAGQISRASARPR